MAFPRVGKWRGVAIKEYLEGVAEWGGVIKLSTKWSMGRVVYKGELIAG